MSCKFRKAQRISVKMNPKRPTTGHITIKMAKFKGTEKILKAAREKEIVTYKEAPIRLLTDSQQKHYKSEGTSMEYCK